MLRRIKIAVLTLIVLFLIFPVTEVRAEEYGDETMPQEYENFIESLPDSVIDALPNGVTENTPDGVSNAASEISSPRSILSAFSSALGAGLEKIFPTLTILLGIVILASVFYNLSAILPSGIGKSLEFCSRICIWSAIAGISVASLSSFQSYFDLLFDLVASFVPLSVALFAMGGNLTAAASSSAATTAILTVCQFIMTKTAIPVFCLSLSLTLLSATDGSGRIAGESIGESVRKWYMRAVTFVMTVLTGSLVAQSVIAAKADNLAMRSAKFAASSFVPVAGGTVAATLGTLASSVEIMRGAVGVLGAFIIILMLLPVIVELALLRAAFAIVEFVAGILSCNEEKKLIHAISDLYGYLEGIAVIGSVIFIVAFAMTASIATPFS